MHGAFRFKSIADDIEVGGLGGGGGMLKLLECCILLLVVVIVVDVVAFPIRGGLHNNESEDVEIDIILLFDHLG